MDNGIILLKYFPTSARTSSGAGSRRGSSDPVKHWKLSPMDVESVRRWWDYTQAYQAMIAATDTPAAPWYIVPADDKRRARLNLIRHLLDQIPYRKVEVDLPKIPKPQAQPKGVEGGLRAAHIVPSRY